MTSDSHGLRPEASWYDEAKFGLMVVWIPAAIPAFAPLTIDPRSDHDIRGEEFDSAHYLRELPYSEMYYNSMHVPDSPAQQYHREHYGDRPYDDFAAQFREGMEHWDPEPWADLFAESGARYVVLTVKHQDGFLLWPSATPNPHKQSWQVDRDVTAELGAAVRARGMRFGVLYTGGTDLTFSKPFTNWEETQAAIPQDDEYVAYVDAHWRELVERYEPDVLWNDMGYPAAADPAELIRWYRERVPGGVSNDRFGPQIIERLDWSELGKYADFTTLEFQRDYASDAPDGRKWESCRGMGTSFGYNREETDAHYSSSTDLIRELCDCTARGGNLLLSVGPTGAGQIPWSQTTRLLEIGSWLRGAGAAIYGSRPWLRPTGSTADGLEVRYTANDDAVNALVFGTPAGAEVELDVALEPGATASLGSGGRPLTWEPSGHGTRVVLPEIPDEQPVLALALAPAASVKPAGASS